MRLALAALLAVASSGCAAGWIQVRPERVREARPAPDWSGARFTVAGTPLHRWALLRTLRARYGVVDARAAPPEAGAFHVEAVPGTSRTSPMFLAALSVFTFAAVPGVWVDETPVRYALTGPDGAAAEALGQLSERSVSWAPFMLLGPTLLVGMNGGLEDVQLERGEAAEALAIAALRALEPAVEARLGGAEGGR